MAEGTLGITEEEQPEAVVADETPHYDVGVRWTTVPLETITALLTLMPAGTIEDHQTWQIGVENVGK